MPRKRTNESNQKSLFDTLDPETSEWTFRPVEPNAAIRQNLIGLLLEFGVTFDDLATRGGLDPSEVESIIRNERFPTTVDMLRRIAGVLGIAVGELLLGVPPIPPKD